MKTFKCRNISNCEFANDGKLLHENKYDEVRKDISTYKCAKCERVLEEVAVGGGRKPPRKVVLGGAIAISLAILGGVGYAIFGGRSASSIDTIAVKPIDTLIAKDSEKSTFVTSANTGENHGIPTPSEKKTHAPDGGIDVGNLAFDELFEALINTKDIVTKDDIVKSMYKYIDKEAEITVKSNGTVIVPDGKAYSFFTERINDRKNTKFKIVDTEIDNNGIIIKMDLEQY